MEISDEQLLKETGPVVVNNDSMSFKEQEWKSEHEKILVEWADKAMCYRWLHARSHQAYSKTNAWYTIPVIIMSTLTGTANFAQDRFPEDIKPLAQMGIGAVNIFAGILTTIAQFLKIGELNEAHRVSSISWDKFYRNIKVELAKSRDERMHVGHMLKMCKEEYDRLMETSPSIENHIVKEFKHKFQNKPGFEKVKKPDICDTIISAEETRNQWYMKINNEPIIDSVAEEAVRERDTFILEQQRILEERNEELIRHAELKQAQESKKLQEIQETAKKLREEEDEYNLHVEKIIQFINGYEEVYARKPLKEDIINQFQDTIDATVLDKFVSGYMN